MLSFDDEMKFPMILKHFSGSLTVPRSYQVRTILVP